ncbi:hypothetical protein [Dietzia maris]|uniref:DUF58 domain-containing protein n=1 Tax=Dietzia maris TaxID=37915 RepID=A0ABT8GYK4_9ACTN|nr:hypothetical protein [Dietzia maris]MCZ4539857.1 hypothetical protein [Dietzia maris]MDN4505303.1 hypothetical protein [Dietzia maris]
MIGTAVAVLASPLQVEVVDHSPWSGPVVAAFVMSLLSLIFTGGWSIYSFWLSGPRLKVEATYREKWSGGFEFPQLLVMVRNTGRQSISVNNVYVTFSKRHLPMTLVGQPDLPADLKPAHALYGEADAERVMRFTQETGTHLRDVEVSVTTGLGLKEFPLRRVGREAMGDLSRMNRERSAG